MKKIILISFLFCSLVSFGQIEIIDDGATLKLKNGGVVKRNISKTGASLSLSGTTVTIKDINNYSEPINYTLVTNPVRGSATLLMAAIDSMLDIVTSGSGLTNAELRASPVPVSGSFALPSGASTLAEQQTQTTKLTSLDGKDFATETTLNNIKLNQTNNNQQTKISNAANNDFADVENSSLRVKLSYIHGDQITLGQKANNLSFPVVISSDQVGTAGTPSLQTLSIQGIDGMKEIEVKNTFGDIAKENTLSAIDFNIGDLVPLFKDASLNSVLKDANDNISWLDKSYNILKNTQETVGGAIPTNVVLIGGSDGTNIQPLKVSTEGNLKINISTTDTVLIAGEFSGSKVPLQTTNTGYLHVELPSGEQTFTSTNVTTGGTISAGTTYITITTDGSFTGSINGVTRAANKTYTFKAAEGKTLPAITYTVTAGSMDIDKLE